MTLKVLSDTPTNTQVYLELKYYSKLLTHVVTVEVFLVLSDSVINFLPKPPVPPN